MRLKDIVDFYPRDMDRIIEIVQIHLQKRDGISAFEARFPGLELKLSGRAIFSLDRYEAFLLYDALGKEEKRDERLEFWYEFFEKMWIVLHLN